MSRSWRNSLALLGFGFCLIPALLLVLDRIDPPDITRKAATSPILLARHGEVLNILPAGDGQFRLAADPAKIDPFYLTVLLAAEDKRFFQHPGVDPLAMLRAAGQWLTAGHVRSGGSTITMQVARLLEPRRRTVFAKMRQVFRAVQLESRYSKQQILGLYLTLAPFGGNLEGVRMASLAYFGQEPEHLSPDQAILLAILPRSPEANRPDRHPEQTKSAMLRLVARLAAKGVLPATMADQIAATPIKGERIAYGAAPHLARRFARAGGGQSNTHIDKSLQLELEALARAESERQHGVGIAMLVTDLPERRIRAWIGSPGFSAPQGQVDMVTRLRSPGSALKPFIYAIAIDKGLIHPGTRLEDRQTRFGDYVPRNFDRAYTGTVTVTEALQQSLNLPAVILLDRLGPRWFHQTMQTLGLPLALPQDTAAPSLAIALGGVGVDLRELATGYAALATDGEVKKLSLIRGEAVPVFGRLVNRPAAVAISDILSGTPRPRSFLAAGAESRPLAYKTGTSYGFRDAWAVGYSAGHVIAVWVGRPDGSPRPGITGREAAAPLLFRIADLLDDKGARPTMSQDGSRRAPVALVSLPPTKGHEDNMPEIIFPVADGTIAVDRDQERLLPIPLEASGGQPPYRWYVDGLPAPSPPLGEPAKWYPPSYGFSRFTVVDSAGRSASVTTRLMPPG